MSDNNKLIGNKIRKCRKDNKMTMKELAQAIGVSEQAISQYELGKRTIKIDQLYKIADVLGITIDYLLSAHSVDEVDPLTYKVPDEILSFSQYVDQMKEQPYIKEIYSKKGEQFKSQGLDDEAQANMKNSMDWGMYTQYLIQQGIDDKGLKAIMEAEIPETNAVYDYLDIVIAIMHLDKEGLNEILKVLNKQPHDKGDAK